MSDKIDRASLSAELPSYKNPPVDEVVCGTRFRPTDKLRIPHIGLLWDRLRKDYPIIQHAIPISFTKGDVLVDRATGFPLPRVWFINTHDDELVQFQTDRFYFNWRRRNRDYPRYGHVVGNFEGLFTTIKELFKDFDLGEPEPIQHELTYINHIPKGVGWKTIDDLAEVFSDFFWSKSAGRFLPDPEEINWATKFSFPEKKSHLIITLKQAIRAEDELPILIYELKALGMDSDSNVRTWFDSAHEWIVRGFTDLTTEKMHKLWELENA